MTIRNACVAVIVILLASDGYAGPILTLYEDNIKLSTELQVPLVGGGTFQQSASYSGPLLPLDRQAVGVGVDLAEDGNIRENSILYGSSSAELTGSGFGYLNLELGSNPRWIFDWRVGQPIDHINFLPWDSAIFPSVTSTGMLDWTFSLDEDAAFNLYLQLEGNDAVAARLHDLTTNESIFSFSATYWYDGHFNGVLTAGNRYSLSAYVSDSTTSDHSSSLFNFYIPGVSGVVVHDVPEPSAILLYGMGLLAIAATRRRRKLS